VGEVSDGFAHFAFAFVRRRASARREDGNNPAPALTMTRGSSGAMAEPSVLPLACGV